MTGHDQAGSDASALRESYELCAREIRRHLPPLWTATDMLPSSVRPHLHAVHGFALRTDRIADEGTPEGRMRRLARWRAETMTDLRTGHSTHPLRQAFVDTVLRHGLDRTLIEEFLDAVGQDCAAPPAFETFAQQRHYLRGVTGTIAELWLPLLGPHGPDAPALVSALGEACQMADIFEDLPGDLAAGRCYLPRGDLRDLGLEPADLLSGGRREALDELVGRQLTRWQSLLEEAVPVTGAVEAACRPFLYVLLLGAQLQYDEAVLLRSRVLTDGVAPLTPAGTARRPPATVRPGHAMPGHVAVIMDGNRRWARRRGLPAWQGHHAGGRALIRLVNAALRLGIRHLTVYAFSTENWNRAQQELVTLFAAAADAAPQGAAWLHELGVRVRWCGRRDRIEQSLAAALALLESMTFGNDVLDLTVCVDYGGRDELAAAARALAAEAVAGTLRPEDIGPDDLARCLYAPGLPDVDLLIRTSGEQRISNFLPWQLAYAELLFTPDHWPDFGLAQLREACAVYASRERRYGAGLPAPATPAEPTRTG
ncbi:polyprenyl diphosphate synthase [Streptomyces albus]|uniref:polyprenyl diphosphate synthase n=1 Tax=Streptomyces albus TaxID=1888 RepID=UPI003452B475